MTVLPGSLDYLYYNGVLDHIPYEAYEMLPATQSGMMQNAGLPGTSSMGSLKQAALGGNMANFNGTQAMNGSQYLDSAMKGAMYDYYTNSNDCFTRSTSSNYNQQSNFTTSAQPYGINNGVGGGYNYKNAMYGLNDGLGNNSGYNYKNAMYGLNSGIGTDVDYERMANDSDGKNLRVAITESANSAKERVLNSPSWAKGLIAAALIIATPFLIIKGHKNSAKKAAEEAAERATKSGFWSKLNPKNWFKNNLTL